MSPLSYDHRTPQGEYETDHKTRDLENGAHEKDVYGHGPGPADPYTTHAHDGKPVVAGDEMRIAGVKRIEAISAQLGPVSRGFVFFGCFLLAYGYGLDGNIRYNYQSLATGSFGVHSLLTTVNVIRAIIGAVGQPTAAKIADVFGRLELLLVSIVFYVVGTIVEATASGDGFLEAFAAGAVLYQIGYTMAILLVEVMIADLSSLRTRLFFSFVPNMPFLINTWVSGDVFAAVLLITDWRWGIGMWAIIYPFSCLVLIAVLSYAQIKARRAGALADYRSPFQTQGMRVFATLFWQLDVVGILLMIIAFGFFLTPFTLAGGASASWGEAKIIAPLVVGILFIPIFVVWELKCRYPLIPFHLLRDRGVWAGFGIACTLNTAWYMQGAYLFPVLQVAFGQSNLSATRIGSIFTFASTLTGIILGIIVMRVRRLKAFIVFGCCLFAVGFGLLIRFRTGANPSDISGLIGGEVVIGIAVGMFSYPTLASVQARTKHEHVAVVTGLYLACYNIGNALGNTISGAVWTNRMPIELSRALTNQTLAASVFANPYGILLTYPFGTPERDGMLSAYGNVQMILAIIGVCLCVPLVGFSLLLRDPTLTSDQSLANAETEELRQEEKARGWFSWR